MPRWLTQLRLRFRSLFLRGRVERELDEELQYHLERQIEEGVAVGLAPEEAHYAALCTMGAITQSKDECRDMRRVNWIEDLVQAERDCIAHRSRGHVRLPTSSVEADMSSPHSTHELSGRDDERIPA